eukprot:2066506-Rhodomonas_salina.4
MADMDGTSTSAAVTSTGAELPPRLAASQINKGGAGINGRSAAINRARTAIIGGRPGAQARRSSSLSARSSRLYSPRPPSVPRRRLFSARAP